MLSRSILNAGRSRVLATNLRSFSSTTAVQSDYDVVVVGKLLLMVMMFFRFFSGMDEDQINQFNFNFSSNSCKYKLRKCRLG